MWRTNYMRGVLTTKVAVQGLEAARLRGDRLRAARVQLALTQEDMAVAVGISVSEYGRWERNKLKKLPPANEVLMACLKLQIGIQHAMNMREDAWLPEHLSDDEREVLNDYRALTSPEAKESARRRLRALRDGHEIGDVVPFRRPRK